MSMLKPFLLLFSGNVSYQTSNNLRSVSQKLAHNQHKHKLSNRRGAKFLREMDFVSPGNRHRQANRTTLRFTFVMYSPLRGSQ